MFEGSIGNMKYFRIALMSFALVILLYAMPSSRPRFEADFFGMTYVGYDDNLIDHAILSDGAWEKFELYFMRDAIKARPHAATVFIDVGANTGQHSLFMSQYVKEVHAFEPYPSVAERFRDMVALNRLRNITIHQVGLGRSNESLPFYEPDASNPASGSFVNNFFILNHKQPSLNLQLVVGDQYLAARGVTDVTLIKVDVEGFERFALQGMRGILTQDRPVVVFELNPQSEGGFRNRQDLLDTFPPNYGFQELLAEGGNPSGRYSLRELPSPAGWRPTNLVAYPAEERESIPQKNA